MRIVPKARTKRISWYKLKANKWAEDPTAIGCAPEEIAALQEAVDEARVARIEQARAQTAALMATQRLKLAIERMSTLGSNVIGRIRATAGSDDDPKIYIRASLPRPRKPSPIGKPGMPYAFQSQLHQIGWLALTWKCDNPTNAVGTFYKVCRQINNEGEFVYLGHAGKKKFVDKTLPAGAAMVMYQVQASRTTGSGAAAEYFVRMGGAANLPELQKRKAA